MQNGLFRNKLCGFQIGSFHRMNILVREHVPKIPRFDTTDVGALISSFCGMSCRHCHTMAMLVAHWVQALSNGWNCRAMWHIPEATPLSWSTFQPFAPPSQPHVVTTKSYLSRTTLWCPRRYLVVTLLCMLLFWDTKFVVIRPPNLMREEPSKINQSSHGLLAYRVFRD